MPAWWGGLVIPVLVLGIFSIGRTSGEIGPLTVHGWTAGPFIARGVSLAPVDLANAQVAQRPATWRDRDVAVRQFRIGWCRDQGLTAQACPPLDQPERLAARARWCADNDTEEGCDHRFGTLAADFDRDWTIERRAYLDTIPGPDLNGRDLRGASVNRAFLAGINLIRARLEGASLRLARLEGADLGGWRGRTSAERGWRGRTSAARGWRGRASAWRGWRGRTSAARGWRVWTSAQRGWNRPNGPIPQFEPHRPIRPILPMVVA
jgi:hypothetical protein